MFSMTRRQNSGPNRRSQNERVHSMKWVTCGACCRKPGTRGPHTPRCNIVLLGGMAIHKTCLPPALLGISTFAEARATHLLLCSPFHLTVVASFCFILCRSRHASRFLTWPAQEGLVDFMCRLTHLVARSPPLPRC
jgi:hypothetical protein